MPRTNALASSKFLGVALISVSFQVCTSLPNSMKLKKSSSLMSSKIFRSASLVYKPRSFKCMVQHLPK